MTKPSEFIEQGWCKMVEAVDANKRAVRAFSPAARAWCLMGAIQAAFYLQIKDFGYGKYIDFRNDCCKLLNVNPDGYNLTDWNDDPSRTKEEVLALLYQVERKQGEK